MVKMIFLDLRSLLPMDNLPQPNQKLLEIKYIFHLKMVKKPKRVRYGWKNYFEATLSNEEGLPASSFLTP
jgi:hypothetical protein